MKTIRNLTESQAENLAAALTHARAGLFVFPCNADDKNPVAGFKWKEWATNDEAKIHILWNEYPDAVPALPTGERNGFAVIDLDIRPAKSAVAAKDGARARKAVAAKNGVAAYRALGLDPDSAGVISRTPSGGRHLLFEYSGQGNSAGKTGIDTRGEGGYIIAPGAVTPNGIYRVIRGRMDDIPLIGLPSWPSSLAGQHDKPDTAPESPPTAKDAPDTTQREIALVRLSDAAVEMSEADEGQRNAQLNEHACAMGRLAGLLSDREIMSALLDAAGICGLVADDGQAPCRATIRSGIKGGRLDPSPPVTADAFDDAPEPMDTFTSRLTFLTPDQCASLPARDYLVKGMIAPEQVGCIFGDPGAGKSLIAI